MKLLRTLWAVVLALTLGFAVQAQQTFKNLIVSNLITTTINGYNADSVLTNSAATKLDITNGTAVNLTGSITNATYDGALLRDVKVAFVQNLQTLLSEASPTVAKLAYVLEDDSNGDATRGTYRYDPTLTGAETATVFQCQDQGGNTATPGRWVRMSAGDNYQMSVDTLDDALAVTPAYLAASLNPTNSIKLTVKTRSRKTLGKGGAATYYYSTSAPAATNAGTVVPYGSGYLLWDGEGQVTPQMFGAKGDASNDDAAAIQAAINYLATVTNSAGVKVGGTLYFPPGVYYIRTAISMKPRVNLLGPGKNRSENYQQTGSITGLGSGGAASLLPDPSYGTAIETILFDGTTSTELPTKGSGTTFLNGENGEMFPFYSTIEGMNIYGTLVSTGGRKSAIRIWRSMFVTIKNTSVMQARGNLIYAYGCLGLRLQDNTLINYHGRNTFIFALSDGFLLNNQFEAGLGYNLWAQMNHNALVGNSFPNPHEDLYVGSLDGAATNAFTSFTASASTDLITATLNGAPLTTMTVGDPVFFHANSGTLPGGLSENVAYFVSTVDTTAGTFSVSSRVAATSGGTGGAWEGNKLDITSAGSGNWSVSQAAESNLLLYSSNGNSITGGRIDYSLRDGIRVVSCSYPAISGIEISSVGRMQGLRAIATRTNAIAGLHLMTTTSEGSFSGAINMSATNGVGRYGVWLDGTGLYRNALRHTYNSCDVNVQNDSTATANTVDYLDQGGGTMLWKAPATVSGPWTFNSPPLMQNSTAGSVGAVVKGQEATSVLDIYGAGTTAGLGPRVNFYRSRGTLASPTQTQAGDAVMPLIAQALDNASTYRAVAEIQANAENNVTSSAFGGSVVLRAVPIGAATSRQNFFYGLSRGVAISDSTAGYPDTTTVLDLVSTTRGLGLPSMTSDVTSARDGTLWYRSDTDVLKLRANSANVTVATQPATETLAYSSTTVTVTAGKGPNQSSVLTCTNNFTLSFTGLADNDGGAIWVHPAATNCTVTLSSPAYGPSGTTLTIAGGGATPTNHTVIAWKATTVNSTNVIDVNALNYYR